MARYLANGTTLGVDGEEQESESGLKRMVRAFVDLHSYGQLCESFPCDRCGPRDEACKRREDFTDPPP
jgi:hypothetical protein